MGMLFLVMSVMHFFMIGMCVRGLEEKKEVWFQTRNSRHFFKRRCINVNYVHSQAAEALSKPRDPPVVPLLGYFCSAPTEVCVQCLCLCARDCCVL